MPFSSASSAVECGFRRGSEEPFVVLDFFEVSFSCSASGVLEALRLPFFAAAFLGGIARRDDVEKEFRSSWDACWAVDLRESGWNFVAEILATRTRKRNIN